MTVITAKQQSAFEALAAELAASRRISRQYAIELLVNRLGGGAEKIAAS
jgi:hypothetical protein